MSRRALRAELPVRSGRGREVLGRPLLQIGGGNVRVVVAHEPLELVGSVTAGRGNVGPRTGDDVVEQSVVQRAIRNCFTTSNVTTSFGARVGASRHDPDPTRPLGKPSV